MEMMKDIEKKLGFHVYDGMTMSTIFPAYSLDKIKETAFHDEDIFVATYAKCGTTWMQEIVRLIQNDGKDDGVPLYKRYMFIESVLPGIGPQIDQWSSTPPPHYMKTHCGANFFEKTLKEKKTKFFVVFRNAKDMLVSYFNFYKMNKVFKFSGTWDEFFNLFKENKLVHGDYFKIQLSYWKLRDDPRILILKYEDMLKSPEDAIRQVMKHLGKSLTDEVVKQIAEKTSFKSMKANPLSNYSDVPLMQSDISPFMRKGQVGDWKNYFSKEQADYVDKLSAVHFEANGLYLKDY